MSLRPSMLPVGKFFPASGLFLNIRRLASDYGWCSLHEKKVPLGHLRKLKVSEYRNIYKASKANLEKLFQKIPHVLKVPLEGALLENRPADNLMACHDNHACPSREDNLCHLHNWRQEKENLVTLSTNPAFNTCTSINPCSVLITGKARLRIRNAKTKFSQLARVLCGQHKEPRKLCDMTWCLRTRKWVCGQWSPCDKELIRQIGGNYLRPEFTKTPEPRVQNLIAAMGEEKAVCAVHKVLREKIHLVEFTPADERLRNVFICQRKYHCLHTEHFTQLNLSRELSKLKISNRNDKEGDWFCIDENCHQRNACMDFYCMKCGKTRSSKCTVIPSEKNPGHVFPGSTPGDWGCLSCKRTNFSERQKSGVIIKQTTCHFCGSPRQDSSPVVV